MESPPSLARYMSQNSKKRVFPGGSSIAAQGVEVSPSISWLSKSESAKQEPIHHGVIDVDMEGSDNDMMLIDGNTESSGKGKEIFLELSLGRGPSQIQSSKKHSSSESDDVPTDLFNEDDVPTDMYFDDLAYHEYAILQSHFDHMDIPPGVEVPIPWMSGPAEAKMASGVEVPIPWMSGPAEAKMTSGVEVPIPWMSGPAKAKMASTTTSTSSTSKAPSFPSWLTPVSQPTPFEIPSSSLGPTFCKSQLSAKEHSGPTSQSLRAEKSFKVQGSHLKRKLHLDSWHTQSIPGPYHFPAVHFVPPPPMPSWMNLPLHMTTPQASSGFMLMPGAMNPLPLKQVHPEFLLTPDPMNYFPQQQLSSGSVLAPSAMYYFSPEMDPALWTQGQHNIESPPFQCGSASSEEKRRDLGESLKNFRHFKKFDTVQDHSDHYFSKLASPDNQGSKSCARRIQGEWRILEKDLPDTIFVRVYETRMDLLRAVIIGADGTPYHDGLFFFDVFFPSSYPHVPPQVHYHSFGLRINPNLYECGKVCLSLLNTWGGRGTEKWIPGGSTMLQVLVSIQGLILNAKPYFNEPGYAKLGGSAIGEQSSLHYNENTFIFNLKTMVYCMRRPPQHFEDFVVGHYFQSCQDILVACKAYMDGARVGSLTRGCLLEDVGEGDKGFSQNFKAVLVGFRQTLIDTFKKIGAKDCDKFLPLAEKASSGVEQVKIESY
ncbi:hypothetical protein RND71_037171 [Anisodus tanguticus]|uniref:E2 ubiquitin-conjugating enzyme n=1 Tax=Anisodus tanguticus TaxID=243964 RepID=A0AAE1UUT5_9SOLA|nr:hypothetical protein RND71_037171 [Anisodus tanguticus]